MRMSNATAADLHSQDYGVHIHLLNEDWNEPDEWEVEDSFVHQTARITTVLTPTRMRYRNGPGQGWGSWTESIIVATYETRGEGHLLSVHVFADGKMVYQGRNKALAENSKKEEQKNQVSMKDMTPQQAANHALTLMVTYLETEEGSLAHAEGLAHDEFADQLASNEKVEAEDVS